MQLRLAVAAVLAALVSPTVAGSVLRGDRVVDRSSLGFYDTVAEHVVPMRRHDLDTAVNGNFRLKRRDGVPVPQSLKNWHDVYYIIDLQVGNQTIPVSVDTGSSDTWLVQEPYDCISFWWSPGKNADCGFSEGFKGNFSGGYLDDIPFGRAYMDGTFVRGYFGYEDVSIGGLTAKHQRLAIVNYTYWVGDGQTAGLLGLAYPYMTSLDGIYADMPPYDPVFTTMWKDKLISPMFSIALSRHENQGNTTASGTPKPLGKPQPSYLALGGLPPVDVDDASWARTPLHDMSAYPQWGLETNEHGFYIIKADAYIVGQTKIIPDADGNPAPSDVTRNTTQFPVLIDVGSTLSILPTTIVETLYAAFDPPAKYMSNGGLFYARCDARVPDFGIQIGGKVFYISPDDLLRQTARDPTGEWCRIGITDSDSIPHILGVTFMSNVVAVFDIEHSEMRFAARTKY